MDFHDNQTAYQVSAIKTTSFYLNYLEFRIAAFTLPYSTLVEEMDGGKKEWQTEMQSYFPVCILWLH